MKTHRILTLSIASLLLASPLSAVTDTWDGNSPNAGAGDSNISTGLNWADDSAPLSDLVNTDLIFGGTTKLAPNFSAIFSTDSITFNNTAGAFVLGGSTITIGTNGIVNADTQTQTFNSAVTLGTATTNFQSNSGALTFATVNLGANALTWTGAAAGTNTVSTITGTGSLEKSGGNLTYGAAGAVTQAWDLLSINNAAVTLNAATDLTVSTTGSITVSTASFIANGNVTMDATPFLITGSSSGVSVAAGKTLLLQNGASLTSTGVTIAHSSGGTITATGSGTLVNAGANSLVVNNVSSTLNVLADADATFLTLLAGSVAGTATVLFDGAGTTATASGNGSAIGNGGAANVTFSNAASGSFGSVNLSTVALSNAQFNIQSGATVAVSSLLMVDDAVASESGTLTINGAGSAFTVNGAGTATIGAASLSTAVVNVQNGGAFNTGTGITTLNATGSIAITGSTFNANGNLTLNGGQFTRDATSVFNLAAGKTLTVQNGGDVIITGNHNFITGATITVTGSGSTLTTTTGLSLNGGSTTNILAGGSISAGSGSSTVSIGTSGNGTVTVDGSGSTLAGGLFVGQNGATGSLTFTNGSTGAFGAITVGNSTAAGSTGTLSIQSGATVTCTGLFLATLAAATSGTVTITGTGSALTIGGTASAIIGGASLSTGTLNVQSGGTFTSGTGSTTVNATGTINITNATYNSNGNLTLTGGAQLLKDSAGAFNFATGKTLTIQSGSDATFTGAYTHSTASTIAVTGAGSTFSTSGTLSLIGGSTTTVSSGGSLSSGANPVNIGTSGDGTVTVSGSGSSFTGGNLVVGNAGSGSLTFSSGSTGAFGNITVDASTTLGNSGTFLVRSGASVTGTGLSISPLSVGNNGVVAILDAGSALTLTGGATTSIGASSLSVGGLQALNGGTFTSGTGAVSLNATGVLDIDGGTVNLLGPLLRNGGVVNFTAGSLSIIDNFTVGLGGLLGTSLTLDSTRSFTTTATTTIDAFRTLTIDGGTFSTGALVSNGTLAFAKGTLAITGAGGFNIGTGALGANVTLGTGANLQVTNTATVASGASLTVDGGSVNLGVLSNSGLVEHVRGTLTITGNATNLTGADFFIAKPMTVGGVFTNQTGAHLTLQNGTGRLSGAGILTNTGLINGDGTIAKPTTNAAGGELRAEAGKTLFLTGTNGTNTGKVNLQGGTIEFSQALTNGATGTFQGRGTANFAGGLTNQGAMNFSAGTTDVFGNINMTGGAGGSARVIASGGGTTTFYNGFIHNGAEVRASDNSTIVFFGAVTGSGPLAGNGTISLEGSYNPGGSPALVTIAPNFVYNGGSLQIMEIFGAQPGTNNPGPLDGHDKLVFTSPAAVQVQWGGTLEIDLGNDFHPLAGMTFDLFDFDNTRDSGTFSSIVVSDPNGLLAPGLAFDYSRLYTDGTVTVAAAPAPEPTSALLLVLGGASLALRHRVRSRGRGRV